MADRSFDELAIEWLKELNAAIDAVDVEGDSLARVPTPQRIGPDEPLVLLAVTRQSVAFKCRWPILAAIMTPILTYLAL